MRSQSGVLAKLSLVLVIIAGASLVLLSLLVFVDVVGRYLFNNPLPFAVELIELLVAITVM